MIDFLQTRTSNCQQVDHCTITHRAMRSVKGGAGGGAGGGGAGGGLGGVKENG